MVGLKKRRKGLENYSQLKETDGGGSSGKGGGGES